jgi:4a-hydroxytetrahydrobiopterin dehydratase
MIIPLHERTCKQRVEATKPLTRIEILDYLYQLKDWSLSDNSKCIEKYYSTKSFSKGIELVRKVAIIAEEEGHHPEIYLKYAEVKLSFTTHEKGYLTELDFILAARIDLI